MSERNRGRVHLNERRHDRNVGRPWGTFGVELDADGYELPDAPENPEFAQLFTEEQQREIDARFQAGIAEREQQDGLAYNRALGASHACHVRFNKPRRPDRKQRTLTAKLGDKLRPGR